MRARALVVIAVLLAGLVGVVVERKTRLTHAVQSALDDRPRLGPLPIPDRHPDLRAALAEQAAKVVRPNLDSAAALESWQGRIRARLRSRLDLSMQDVGDPIPRLERGAEVDLGGGLRRIEVWLEGADGVRIPGYLFEPARSDPGPAALVIPGHVGPRRSGMDQLAGLDESYQNAGALRIARAGLTTLAIELRGFGRLGPSIGTEHRLIAWNALLAGSFYKALVISDIALAFEALSGLPSTDPARIAVAGASLGGELAALYGAVDERVAAVVFHAYGGWVGPFGAVVGAETRQPHYCHIIPGAASWLHHEDVPLLIAPRPVHGARGEEEGGWRSARFVTTLRRAWETLDHPEALELVTVPMRRHELFADRAACFLSRRLLGREDPEACAF